MNISYTKINDYKIPNLKINDKEKYNIGKYGLLKLEYLKNNQRILYYELLMKNELNEYLYEIDIKATELVNKLIKSLNLMKKICEIMV
ncbi:MAG: TnpV protein [Bacilli bacterium]|nr:TnpV protein [Bacilli bacterium]